MPKTSVRESQSFLKTFWFQEVWWIKRGVSRSPSNVFGLTWPKNLLGNPSLFQKVRGVKKFYAWKGVSQFSVRNCLSQSAKKFRQGTRLCFWSFRVSKNFMPNRGISRLSTENLMSHKTEKLRRGTFFVSQNFWYRKNLWIRGEREYHDFLSEINCLTVPKVFVEDAFSVSLIFRIEIFYASESYVTILCPKICLKVSGCRRSS